MAGTKKLKEWAMNAIGFTLMQIDIDAKFHDSLMEKIDSHFWKIFWFVVIGILSYLI